MKNLLSNLLPKGRREPTRVRSFAALGLSEHLQETLKESGYIVPTPIQALAIPHILRGADLLGCAQTGTGKTAAFALPILQAICSNAQPFQKRRGPRALIVAPTRELAAQIGASFKKYSGQGGPRQLVVFGGVSKHNQVRLLQQHVDVLVATPGRLIDLMTCGAVHLDQVECFVLDEADRMLDMGFIRDVKRIAKALPQHRQTLMFSATMPPEIARLAASIQKDPTRVDADPVSSVVKPIAQSVYKIERSDKSSLLLYLLERNEIGRVLVFTRTKHGANRLARRISRAGVPTAALHGNKSQSARERTLADFKGGKVQVVVATDIAARGIDIKDLSHVVNFDLPNDPESYVHRIGRTGRAGATGVAISFCSEEESSLLRGIEQLIRQPVNVRSVPVGFRVNRPSRSESEAPRQRRRRRRGRRPESYMSAYEALAV